MRLFLRYPLLLSCLLATPLAWGDCPELVQNGDFESGTSAPWSLYSDLGSFYSDEVVEDSYTPGNLFFEFDYTEDGQELGLYDAGMTQPVNLVQGASYRLTFWARGDDQWSYPSNGISPGHVSIAE